MSGASVRNWPLHYVCQCRKGRRTKDIGRRDTATIFAGQDQRRYRRFTELENYATPLLSWGLARRRRLRDDKDFLPRCLPACLPAYLRLCPTDGWTPKLAKQVTPFEKARSHRTNQRAEFRCSRPAAWPGFSLFLLLCVGQLILWHKFSVNSFGQLRAQGIELSAGHGTNKSRAILQ